MTGELIEDFVAVKDEKEASQIYNKGCYGQPQSGGALKLSLIEAVYLFEAKRVEIKRKNRRMSFVQLFRYANKRYPDFEIRYIVYRDLRMRGYVVKPDIQPAHFRVFPRGGRPSKTPSRFWVLAASERGMFDLEDMVSQMRRVQKARKRLLIGIVDEEGDLTYYQARLMRPKGKVKPNDYEISADALFLGDRVLVLDSDEAETLHTTEFFGKFIGEGLQLSLLETAYLLEMGVIILRDAKTGRKIDLAQFTRKAKRIQPDFDTRLKVYKDLKSRGLIVKTGFKYGTHFRVYKGDPEKEHALYLVHAVSPAYHSTWPEISRAVRLAHGVKKELLLGRIVEKESEYIRLKRVRP
ncbi:MAG: tRNA-intron lyase [Methanomassiliicoccales archaeon]|nr:MAG: tRNA-intron lyase [Methanomassiliicoccales archaeon]